MLVVAALCASCSGFAVVPNHSEPQVEEACTHETIAASLELTRDVAGTVLSEEGFRTAFLGDMIRADRRHYTLPSDGISLLGFAWPVTAQIGPDGTPKRHHSLRVQLDFVESRGRTCVRVELTSIGFDLDPASAGQIPRALTTAISRRALAFSAGGGVVSAPAR